MDQITFTERIGAEGKFWVREFPVYLTSHTPGKQNAKIYLNLKGDCQHGMRFRHRTQKHKER